MNNSQITVRLSVIAVIAATLSSVGSVMITTQAYGQMEMEPVSPGTSNSVSNDGMQPAQDNSERRTMTLEDNEVAFNFTMINGKMNAIYKMCGGITGTEILNFGCDQKQWTAEVDTGRNRLGQIWVYSIEGSIGGQQLYGCIIGETEKKISCNTTSSPTPPSQQQLIIDWSQRSATGIPSTFSQTPGSQSIDREDILRQSQQQREGNNNDDEEEEDEDEED